MIFLSFSTGLRTQKISCDAATSNSEMENLLGRPDRSSGCYLGRLLQSKSDTPFRDLLQSNPMLVSYYIVPASTILLWRTYIVFLAPLGIAAIFLSISVALNMAECQFAAPASPMRKRRTYQLNRSGKEYDSSSASVVSDHHAAFSEPESLMLPE